MSTSVVQKIANAGGVGIPVSLTASTGATTTEGILLGTTETATVGAQKFSPSLHFQGSGWKTDATAGAQSCDWKVEVQPVQGTSIAKDQLVLSTSENGGAYTSRWLFGGYNDGIGDYGLFPGSLARVGLIPYSTTDLIIGSISNYYFRFNNSSQLNASVGSIFSWANVGNCTNAADTGLSRISAGLAAVGNGTAGDFSGALKLTRLVTAPLTVGTLPASPSTGARCIVTDAASAAFYTVVATGGANVAPVFYDGAAWRVG